MELEKISLALNRGEDPRHAAVEPVLPPPGGRPMPMALNVCKWRLSGRGVRADFAHAHFQAGGRTFAGNSGPDVWGHPRTSNGTNVALSGAGRTGVVVGRGRFLHFDEEASFQCPSSRIPRQNRQMRLP